MKIPFTKAHGARNDFLLTWAKDVPGAGADEIARAICDRHTGVGADGWILVEAAPHGHDCDASIRLFNADGSKAEISGNGTRCAAAFLVGAGLAGDPVRIETSAGPRTLRLMEHAGPRYSFEMCMDKATAAESDVRAMLPLSGGPREATLVWVGNPQCAVFVENFDWDWRGMGAEIERHPRFPNRTNVSFVKVLDGHTLDVRFFERGVGETCSSGTGTTGAVAAAALRGLVTSPARVLTPGGPLDVRWDEMYYLTGPAEIVATGEFYFEEGIIDRS